MPDAQASPAIPYGWLNHLLVNVILGLFVLSVVLLVYSFFTRRFRKRRIRVLSLWAFGGMLATAAANYALIFFVILPTLAADGQNASRGSRTAVGDRAPAFSVQMTDGTTRSSGELRGKVTVVSFFATWCGPCILELPHLQELYKRHQGDDRFEMLVIGREETQETVQEFVREHGWTFPAAADSERRTFDLFAENGIPRVYVIAPEGKIAFQSIGFTERGITRLGESVDSLLGTLPRS